MHHARITNLLLCLKEIWSVNLEIGIGHNNQLHPATIGYAQQFTDIRYLNFPEK